MLTAPSLLCRRASPQPTLASFGADASLDLEGELVLPFLHAATGLSCASPHIHSALHRAMPLHPLSTGGGGLSALGSLAVKASDKDAERQTLAAARQADGPLVAENERLRR